MKKYLLFVFVLYSVTCDAEPTLQETLSFMTNTMSSDIEDFQYPSTIVETGDCNVTYTNHPKYNTIDSDDNSIIFINHNTALSASGFYSIERTETCTIYEDQNVGTPDALEKTLNEAQYQADKVIDNIEKATTPVKEGFLNYFSNKKNQNHNNFSPEEDFYTHSGNNGIFLAKFNLSTLNPNSIIELENGVLAKTANNVTISEFSSYRVICDDPKPIESNIFHKTFKGKIKIIKADSPINIKSVYFKINGNKEKFRKALFHAIETCGGKDDLF